MSNPHAAIDMTGETVAGCVAIRRLPTDKPKRGRWRGAVWIVRCGCGREFEALGFVLRQMAKRKKVCRCPVCRKTRPNRRNVPSAEVSRLRASAAPVKPERQGKHCKQCAGLSHQRPRVGLCRCGESFRDEDYQAVRREHLDGRRRAIG